MMKTKLLFLLMSANAIVLQGQSGNVGINTTTPGTTLDVNGAITNRETAIAVTGNAATVPANVSQVQLTGAATAAVTITVPAAPNAGQRLVIFNNTTGGFGATLTGTNIPNGKALEFVYSNTGWRSIEGGAAGIRSYDWLKAGDAQPTAPGDNSTDIYHIGGHVGIGISNPVGKLHLYNSSSGTEAGNDYVIDDESPISQIQGMVIRRSNAGANLTLNDFIGSILFNPKINGMFGYAGAGMASIYRGNGTNLMNALIFRVNNNQEAMRLDENANVGIGTATPSTRLDVEGRIRQAAGAPASNNATNQTPMYRDNTTGLLYAAPTGFTKISGGFRPGANTVVYTIDPTNSITMVRFSMYPDESSTLNNGYANNYLYGTFTITATEAAGGTAKIRNIQIFNGDGTPITLTSGGNGSNAFTYNTDANGGNQGVISFTINTTTGVIEVANLSAIYSFFFEFMGGI